LTPRVKKYLLVSAKLIAMLGLLVLIGNQVHWRDYQVVSPAGELTSSPGLSSSLKDFSLLPFLAAMLFQLAAVFLTAFRWRLLMLVQGIGLDRASVVRLSFLGEFFNQFLPGALGGDAVKAYFVMRHTGRKGATLVSIFANRFVGLSLLCLVSATMLGVLLLTGHRGLIDLKQPVFAIFVIAAGIGVVLLLSLNVRLNNSAALRRLIGFLPFSRQLEMVRVALHRYRQTGSLLPPLILYSLLIVSAFVLCVMSVGLSLGINLAWYHYVLYLPLIAIMTAVPVTPGGVGVLEELFIYFFSAAGDPNKILAMALLYRLVLLLCGLPGAVIFLLSEKISRQDLAAGLQEMEKESSGD
jgi:uncharacterized protein (TIRG00374 family)